MVSAFSTAACRTSRFARWIIAPVLIFFLAGDVFLFAYVALHRADMRTAAEQRLKDDTDHEDQSVCSELGLGSGRAFETCANALARVRQRHEARIESDTPF